MCDLVDIVIPAAAQSAAETLGLKVSRSVTTGVRVRRISREDAEKRLIAAKTNRGWLLRAGVDHPTDITLSFVVMDEGPPKCGHRLITHKHDEYTVDEHGKFSAPSIPELMKALVAAGKITAVVARAASTYVSTIEADE